MAKCKKKAFCNFLQMFYSDNSVLLLFFILICVLNGQKLAAQNEMQLSGYANMPIVANPGAAGKTGTWNAVGAFRKQWIGFDGAPQTTILSIDGEIAFLKNFHGVGATVIHDKSGPLTLMNINANYSYHIELSKGQLGIGARLGALNAAFKLSDLSATVNGAETDYHQSSDQALEGNDDSGTTLDIGVGAFYQSEKSYISLSMLHVNRPKITFKSGTEFKSRPIATLGAGQKFGNSQLSFEPRFFFKSDFALWQLEMSGNMNIKKMVTTGIGYRLQDAIFFMVGINLSNGLYVGYTYDLCVSDLHRYNSGSHEVGISYTFNIDVEKRTKRYKSVRIL